jgi:hypothetical protein
LGELALKDRWLVVGAVAVQIVGGLIAFNGGESARHAYVSALAVSAGLALVFCLRNLRIPGVTLVTVGLALNATVVGLNGAMPVSIVAAYHARVPITTIAADADARHTIAGRGTTWRVLGDVIPVPLPVHPEVISPGDVLVAAGLGELVVLGMMGPTRFHRRQESSDGEEGPQASRA